ncbi:TonB-dependent receptor [Montanilutibacter psychrotolerans]|nr:TonB-dependent receptor [Lysobacter psychrotolerans]
MRQHQLASALALVLSSGVLALALPGTARAQDSVSGEAASDKAAVLDSIIVTAQSREQQLQDVPIALQVVNDALIEEVAAEDLGDLDSFVPGLVVDSLQPTQSSIALRGISTDDFGIGTDPAVGVYIDGVYAGRGGGMLLPFTDVERIEVLKGPQGTLFGRNTAAGAISIVTRSPADEVEARARLRVGNYGKRYFETMVNVPTGEDAALRLSALVNHSDGWLRDAATGEDLGGEDTWATRAAFKLGLGDNTSAVLSWDHESLDQNARPTTGIVPLPPAPGRPAVPLDPLDYLDPRKVDTFNDLVDNDEWRTFDGVNLIVDHAFTWGHLTSTSAWRQYDAINHTEEDGTNRVNLYIDSENTESNESVYQEFKFNGSSARLDWVAGVSYFAEDSDQTSEVNTLTDAVDTAVFNLGLAATPDGTLFNFFTQVAQANGIPVSLLGHQWNEKFVNTLSTKSYAAFGDVIWHANDKLNLTFGLRYTRDEKRFSWFNDQRDAPTLDAALDQLEAIGFFQLVGVPREAFVFDLAFIDPPAMLNKGRLNGDRKSWSDFSPRFVVDYHFNDRSMVYASLAKGYKAGGYNALQIGSSFDNEDVWNVEAGIKQAFPDWRLQYNASVFHYVYSNRQSVRLDSSTVIPRFVVDTGDLQAWGLEFDTRWQATDAFVLDFNAAFIDSEFKDYTGIGGNDLSGQPTGEPYFSAAAGASYRWQLGDAGDLRLSARHTYRGATRCNDESQTQTTCGTSPALDQGEAQSRTDLRLGWSSASGRLGMAVYGHNLADNRYVTGLNTYGKDAFGTVGATVSEPRTYGFEVTLQY